MKLILVESPTKSKTLKGFLEKEYEVFATMGHIRDLPKSKLGIDIENNFQPQYVIPTKARKTVNQLKKETEKTETIILATDEDREGEAIAWHLVQALGLENSKSLVQRIVFHEITEKAIKEALKNPRGIDMNLVASQQARRILDRLVGYKLSPFLWEKVAKRLSAGRVQSVALRFIAERENEIRNFKSAEYWTIAAFFLKLEKNFEAQLKLDIKTKEESEKITADLEKSEFRILKIEKRQIKKNPLPPFTTSTLQQEAVKRLHLSAKQTMFFAQGLYEKGFITYMRTDSLNLSQESLAAAKSWIENNLGEDYASQAPRIFKTKSRLAQEAHEAVRPTRPDFTPQNLSGQADPKSEKNEARLYELIWRRFIASQLPQAIFDSTRIEITAKNPLNSVFYILNSTGNILRFDGFLKIWAQKVAEKELPELKENEILKLKEIKPEQHFTEPPGRYNEASLIKTLEEYGIGRPSTYAPIISVIQERNYVQKNAERRFEPTEIGELVNKVLTEHFPKIVDIKFTAKMEEELDEIAQGQKKWPLVIKEFYEPFAENLEQKYQEVEKQKPVGEKTEEVCEKCGQPMVIKFGRFGRFLACSGFPDCKNAKPLTLGPCPKCQTGKIVARKTKKGRFFYGCNRYPECDYATWKLPEKEKPPELND